jgi:hypothetical protein
MEMTDFSKEIITPLQCTVTLLLSPGETYYLERHTIMSENVSKRNRKDLFLA